jgi:hypothetical protein
MICESVGEGRCRLRRRFHPDREGRQPAQQQISRERVHDASGRKPDLAQHSCLLL